MAIGAGIIGVSVALALQAVGRDVVLVDRSGPGAGASRATAGAFAFFDIVPLATPGIIRAAPKWLCAHGLDGGAQSAAGGAKLRSRLVDRLYLYRHDQSRNPGGDLPAIIPQITGRGWITDFHQHLLDPDGPWPEDYRLKDTWGVSPV